MKFVGHSNIIAGTAADVPRVIQLLKSEGVEIEGNPDLYTRNYTHFGVDEARDITARASVFGVRSSRVFVLGMPSMTTEAQNALLKTIEEPPAGARFFFVTPSPESLLPTVRSRSQIVRLESSAEASIIDAKKFLAASPAKRLDALKPLLEKGEEDRRDMAGMLTFLSSLERILGSMGAVKDPAIREGLDAIYRARKYADDKGSLMKPLLEQVALLAPVIS